LYYPTFGVCQVYGISDGHGISLKLRLAWLYFNRIFQRDNALGPSVMQYFPRAGDVEVSVKLKFMGEEHDVESQESLPIRRSREFRVMNAFEDAELLSWGLALVIAIASGLSIYYISAPGWGTFKDCLTLFLWGVGVEQGKNFLQSTGAPK
jgi:hypothetical protein